MTSKVFFNIGEADEGKNLPSSLAFLTYELG